MAKGRKLLATFKDGSVLSRTTTIPTLSHAWKVRARRLYDGRMTTRGTGFASGREKAFAALNREYPASQWDVVAYEIVECVVLP